MSEIKLEKKNLWMGAAFILVAGLLLGIFAHSWTVPTTSTVKKSFADMSLDEQKMEINNEISSMKIELKSKGKYACCIIESCNECLLDEGECDCAQRVMMGNAPCGECMGEILEGNGEIELAPYFAKAISHKVGDQHLDHLKSIMTDIYNISVEEQA